MNEDGVPTGIDVELATEAFKRMGYQVEVVQINWEKKKELVESGEIDCIMGCFSMEGRLDDYRWAGPYIASRQVVAVNENSDIYKLSDLEGKNLAVQSTTKPEGIFLNRTDERIPKLGNLISLGHRELIYTFLGKGYVDAVAAHEESIVQYRKDYDASCRILEEPLMITGIGVAFAKEDADGDGVPDYDFYGCYFADAGNTFGNRNDLSRNTIIYGHNMHNVTTGPKDTLKFGALFKFVDFNNDGTIFGDDVASANDFSFAEEHPVIYFSTTDDEMVWVIYAAYFTDLGFQYHLENPDDATFSAMIQEAKDRSRLDYDVDVNTSDRILTLSTCA